MASTKLLETKDGRRFWKIQVSRGHGITPFTTRFYWPLKENGDPVAQRTAERALGQAVAEFERACAAGEVLTREDARKIAAHEAAEAAKLKTFRQYALGVYMAVKEQSFSENARSSYMMFLDKHIFPVFGDLLLVDITTAMINKFLLNFQKQGYAQATITKLYNILNGVFQMAFMDDSIPVNPMLKVTKPKQARMKKLRTQAKRH